MAGEEGIAALRKDAGDMDKAFKLMADDISILRVQVDALMKAVDRLREDVGLAPLPSGQAIGDGRSSAAERQRAYRARTQARGGL